MCFICTVHKKSRNSLQRHLLGVLPFILVQRPFFNFIPILNENMIHTPQIHMISIYRIETARLTNHGSRDDRPCRLPYAASTFSLEVPIFRFFL